MIIICACNKELRGKEQEKHHKDFPNHRIKYITCCGHHFKNNKELERHFEIAHLFFRPID